MSGGHGAQEGKNQGYREWMWGFEDVLTGTEVGQAEGWACVKSRPRRAPQLPQSWLVPSLLEARPWCRLPQALCSSQSRREGVSFLLVMHANQVDNKTK